MNNEKDYNNGIYEALFELKTLQDFLTDSSTRYFGKLLAKLVGVDTIPIFLLTTDTFLSHEGVDINQQTGEELSFTTCYFRIESIEKEEGFATVSLLHPLDIEGNDAHSLSDVIQLKKTATFIKIDLSSIIAIQPLEIELLKRKIIIEPKW